MLFIDSAGENTAKEQQGFDGQTRTLRQSYPYRLAAIDPICLASLCVSRAVRVSSRRCAAADRLVTLMTAARHGICPFAVASHLVQCPGRKVRCQRSCATEALPWLRHTRTSNHGEIVTPDMSHLAEAFFAMPRRLRLQFEGHVRQLVLFRNAKEPNTDGWVHPLSPYNRLEGLDWKFCRHIRRSLAKSVTSNWLGLAFGQGQRNKGVSSAKSVSPVSILYLTVRLLNS